MKCSICDKDKKLLNHHLSYNPEIIIKVCHACHFAMHNLANIVQNQRDIILDYVRQYGHLWENGAEKHFETKHYKDKLREYSKKYQKGDEYKRYNKKRYNTSEYKIYNKENRLQKNPEKFLREIEDMERKCKIIGGTA